MADRRRDRGSSSVSFVAAAVLARQPLSIASELGPGAVDQRVGRSRRRAVGYIGHRRSLPPARDGKVRHRAGESCHVQDAGHHARALPRRQTKQNLPHQAKLDCCIGERRRASRAARPLGEPLHIPVKPDQQRSALLQGIIVGFPLHRAVADRSGLRDATRINLQQPLRELLLGQAPLRCRNRNASEPSFGKNPAILAEYLLFSAAEQMLCQPDPGCDINDLSMNKCFIKALRHRQGREGRSPAGIASLGEAAWRMTGRSGSGR